MNETERMKVLVDWANRWAEGAEEDLAEAVDKTFDGNVCSACYLPTPSDHLCLDCLRLISRTLLEKAGEET